MADWYGTNSGDESFSYAGPTPITVANGGGVDSLFGFDGGDTLQGYLGADHLYGQEGDDFLHGYRENKGQLDVNDGGDFLYGGDGVDTIHGDHGNDTIYGDYYVGYNDSLNGGAGVDTVSYFYSTAAVLVRLDTGSANDGMGGTDTLADIENAAGTAFGDTFYGNAAQNAFQGGDGNDYFAAWNDAGADTYNGQGGAEDWVSYISAASAVSVRLDLGWTFDPFGSYDTLISIEKVSGSDLGDYIVGNGVANVLYGRGGGDTINGGGGGDRIEGGSGADEFDGGSGNDTLYGESDNDVIDGGSGADDMYGGGGNDHFYVDSASDEIFEYAGGGAFDRVLARVNYGLASGVQVEILSTANLNGTTTRQLTGNEFAQTLLGDRGANRLDGKGGADSMSGLAGDDFYIVDNAGDRTIESAGGGFDRVAAGVNYQLLAGQEVELMTPLAYTSTTALNLTGNALDQSIYGNDGVNILDGRGGADIMTGRADDDIYVIDDAGDRAIEAVGGGSDRVATSVSYTLRPGQEVELFLAAQPAATTAINLFGNEFGQSIVGNAGVNIVNGGAGNDFLTGGGGADTFFFNTALNVTTNVDTITDFNVALDAIRLENAVFTGLAAGALAAGAFNTGAAASQADDRIIYNAANGALLFDVDGLGGAAGTRFATLSAGLALTNADFVVI